MQILEATISSGESTQTATVVMDERNETATLTLPRPIAAGAATIAIRYRAPLNDRLRGFYLSHGSGRDYAVTQLEATDARRAFPSFDEPALKATFDIKATIDAGDTAISNGRIVSDTPGPQPGKHTLTFATTPKMSPYLVALIVGEWECVAGCRRRNSDSHLREAGP
jgi:aminopeptidase N